MVEITFAGGQHDVVHIGLYDLCERTVALHAEFQVGAVVAYHVYLCGRKFVALLLIHPSLHGLYDFGIVKTVDMVPTSAVAPVGREESPVESALESHAEVVAL